LARDQIALSRAQLTTLSEAHQLLCSWHATIGSQLIDYLGQRRTEAREEFILRRSSLLDEPLNSLVSQNLFELVRGNRPVWISRYPAPSRFRLWGSTKTLEQVPKPAAQLSATRAWGSHAQSGAK